jgi:hypothetical protein
MSNLIPQKRVNKLGHVVTKHVKADDSSQKPPLSLPAPEITYVDRHFFNENAEIDVLLRTVGTNFDKANTSLTYSHLELIEGTKVQGARRSLLEALAEATDGIDERGAKSLLSGFSNYQAKKHAHNASCLELSARAYEFCRKVDDATPYSTDTRHEYFLNVPLGTFAKEFFHYDLSHASDPDDVTDLEGAYFLDRLDLNDKERFNSEGAYYRAMVQLKERREDIVEYMPLLIAARMVAPADYTSLGDIFDLTDYLKTICPPDKSASVAAECLKRLVFDVDTIEQIAKSDVAPLIDGVL